MSRILLITGPAGAGKSTTSEEFLKQARGTWAYVNQDELRQLVKAGYATADGYEYEWSEETKKQWEVSIPLCCDIARRYNEAGINCLIDFNASPEEFKTWKQHLDGLEYDLVVLLPNEETVLSRNRDRNERSKLKDNKILQNYQKLANWKHEQARIINNSSSLIDETIKILNEIIS